MLAGQPIKVFNEGKMRRDFTYIDDIVEGGSACWINQPHRYGFGSSTCCRIPAARALPYLQYRCTVIRCCRICIEAIEASLHMTAQKNFLPLQAGDVTETFADTMR